MGAPEPGDGGNAQMRRYDTSRIAQSYFGGSDYQHGYTKHDFSAVSGKGVDFGFESSYRS
jgi:hypothetical protein